MYKERIKKLRKVLEKRKLKAVLISSLETTIPNVYYFTGFYDVGSAAYLLLTKDNEFLITREERANREAKIGVFNPKKKHLSQILKDFKIEKNRIGIDGTQSYSFFKALNKKLPKLKFVDIKDDIYNIRQIKDTLEIKNITKACRLTDRILKNAMNKKSNNEAVISRKIKKEVFEREAYEAFPPIVAGDANSSNIHYFKNDMKFKDSVLIDMGVKYNHYCSDVSRTFVLRRDKEILKAKKALIELHKKLDSFVKIGRTGKQVHDFAKKELEKAGYVKENFGKFYILGHGVGLDIHEEPILSPNSKTRLKENMVFALEPGIYFKGRFGVRTEDTVLLTKKGIKRLSKSKW